MNDRPIDLQTVCNEITLNFIPLKKYKVDYLIFVIFPDKNELSIQA